MADAHCTILCTLLFDVWWTERNDVVIVFSLKCAQHSFVVFFSWLSILGKCIIVNVLESWEWEWRDTSNLNAMLQKFKVIFWVKCACWQCLRWQTISCWNWEYFRRRRNFDQRKVTFMLFTRKCTITVFLWGEWSNHVCHQSFLTKWHVNWNILCRHANAVEPKCPILIFNYVSIPRRTPPLMFRQSRLAVALAMLQRNACQANVCAA